MDEQNPFVANENARTNKGVAPGRCVGPGRSIEWLKQGWQLFTKNPGIWLAITAIVMVIGIALVSIPIVAPLALVITFLMPVFVGGILLGCKSLSDGGEFGINYLFVGFKQNTSNLIMVSVFYFIGAVVINVLVFFIVGGSALTGGVIGHWPGVGVVAGGFLFAMLILLLLHVPLVMAVWFAPALVVFRNVAPLDAMKMSFFACLKNIVPFTVYCVIIAALFAIAVIPVALGMLIMLPVTVGSVYASYVDIFE